MTSRGRKVALFVGVAGLVLVAAAVVAAGLVTASRHHAAVAVADKAATEFTTAQSRYEATVKTALDRIDVSEPGRSLAYLERDIGKVPRLEQLSGYGAEHSHAYKSAKAFSSDVDLTAIRSALTDAAATKTYAVAAHKALENPHSFAPAGPFVNGDPIRSKFVQRFRDMLASYLKVTVPAGAEAADKEVKKTLNFMIDEGNKLAAKLDAHQGSSFVYAERYKVALKAVDKAGSDARVKVSAAITLAYSEKT